ncbi:MAG: hypothetical protein ACLRR6_05150 [Oscillospiraceae bacterium]
MYLAMFTAPKPMTAYGFPTGNGAGFRRESAGKSALDYLIKVNGIFFP